MKSYIFLTAEGYTYQPESESFEPDVENMQVPGFAKGENEQEAFANFIAENQWLLETTFDEVTCMELMNNEYEKHAKHFSMKAASEGI